MKRTFLQALALGLTLSSFAQTDSASRKTTDTIKIGGMIIIRSEKDSGDLRTTRVITHRKKSRSNVSTNWGVVDLGFANYTDRTNYSNAALSGFVAPGMNKNDLELRTGKSVNVNLWLFMQRVNLIRHAVNFKYGLGLELNNYHYDNEQVRLTKNPTQFRLEPQSGSMRKNKLAADYVTIPLMLNFNLTPGRSRGFGFSAGLSGGYLYAARQKLKMGDQKVKTRGNFDLEKWKVAYIAELNMGLLHLYGSFAEKSMWQKGLDQTPYAIGIRLSHL